MRNYRHHVTLGIIHVRGVTHPIVSVVIPIVDILMHDVLTKKTSFSLSNVLLLNRNPVRATRHLKIISEARAVIVHG